MNNKKAKNTLRQNNITQYHRNIRFLPTKAHLDNSAWRRKPNRATPL